MMELQGSRGLQPKSLMFRLRRIKGIKGTDLFLLFVINLECYAKREGLLALPRQPIAP
jgi:hypothetical protein